MNATSLEELRAAQAGHSSSTQGVQADTNATPEPASNEASSDAKMEQIRQLLLGDHVLSADRLAALESRQDHFEKTVLHRLDLISQRLDALSRDVLSDRRAAFDELARSMQELSQRIRGI